MVLKGGRDEIGGVGLLGRGVPPEERAIEPFLKPRRARIDHPEPREPKPARSLRGAITAKLIGGGEGVHRILTVARYHA